MSRSPELRPCRILLPECCLIPQSMNQVTLYHHFVRIPIGRFVNQLGESPSSQHIPGMFIALIELNGDFNETNVEKSKSERRPRIEARARSHKRRFNVFTYDEVFWLNVTNIVLGLATLICLVVVGYSVLKETRERFRNAAAAEKVDDHAFLIDGLGVTMADGGEKVGDDEMLVVSEDGIESVPKNESPAGKRREGRK